MNEDGCEEKIDTLIDVGFGVEEKWLKKVGREEKVSVLRKLQDKGKKSSDDGRRQILIGSDNNSTDTNRSIG